VITKAKLVTKSTQKQQENVPYEEVFVGLEIYYVPETATGSSALHCKTSSEGK